MKSVVNAVSTIIEDVRMFEHRPSQDRADVDPDALRSLRDRVEATLSNLVTASKTHATSSGMSPVSLLDAAASHVSATVTEIGRTLRIRKTTKVEQEQFSSFSSSYAPPTNGFSPSLRSVEEVKGSHQRKGSATNSRQNNNISSPQSVSRQPESISAPRSYVDLRHRLPSEPSSAEGSSPPPSFDQLPINSGGIANDESGMADGSEDAWAELKVRGTDVLFFLVILMLINSHTLRPRQNRSYTPSKAYYLAFAAPHPLPLSTRTSHKSLPSYQVLSPSVTITFRPHLRSKGMTSSESLASTPTS